MPKAWVLLDVDKVLPPFQVRRLLGKQVGME